MRHNGRKSRALLHKPGKLPVAPLYDSRSCCESELAIGWRSENPPLSALL